MCGKRLRRYSIAAVSWGLVMKRFSVALIVAIVAIAAIGLTQIASAADLPAKAPAYTAPTIASYNWTGFYLGGHFGYLWGRTTLVDNGVVTDTNAPTNGAIGGVLGGYNWQNGALVLGVEGDIGWTNARGTGQSTQTIEIHHYNFDWTSHIRGRAGYASGPWLFFRGGGCGIHGIQHDNANPVDIIPCQGAVRTQAGRSAAVWTTLSTIWSALGLNISMTIWPKELHDGGQRCLPSSPDWQHPARRDHFQAVAALGLPRSSPATRTAKLGY